MHDLLRLFLSLFNLFPSFFLFQFQQHYAVLQQSCVFLSTLASLSVADPFPGGALLNSVTFFVLVDLVILIVFIVILIVTILLFLLVVLILMVVSFIIVVLGRWLLILLLLLLIVIHLIFLVWNLLLVLKVSGITLK
jgi:hypothetical protein